MRVVQYVVAMTVEVVAAVKMTMIRMMAVPVTRIVMLVMLTLSVQVQILGQTMPIQHGFSTLPHATVQWQPQVGVMCVRGERERGPQRPVVQPDGAAGDESGHPARRMFGFAAAVARALLVNLLHSAVRTDIDAPKLECRGKKGSKKKEKKEDTLKDRFTNENTGRAARCCFREREKVKEKRERERESGYQDRVLHLLTYAPFSWPMEHSDSMYSNSSR